MARTKAAFIFATCITSGVALVFSVVALGTNQWVTGTVALNTALGGTTGNQVHYGLFSGIYVRTVSSTLEYSLFVTCDAGENKCAMLCGDRGTRSEYLGYLFAADTSDGYRDCTYISRIMNRKSSSENSMSGQVRADAPSGFINCGAWLSTIIFLILSCIAGVISTILALWNTVSNPVESLFNVFGLLICNSVACFCLLISIIVWGAQFAATLAGNLAIYDTIIQSGGSDGLSSLGYSYWLNIVSLILYGGSITVLLVRQHLINKEPQNIVNLESDKNDAIILF